MPLSEEGRKCFNELFNLRRAELEKKRCEHKPIEQDLIDLAPPDAKAHIKKLIELLPPESLPPTSPPLDYFALEGVAWAETLEKAYEKDGQELNETVIEEILHDLRGHMRAAMEQSMASFKAQVEDWEKRVKSPISLKMPCWFPIFWDSQFALWVL